VYYSYPNMPTRGQMSWRTRSGEMKTLQVTGKSWLDRQWGPYDIINPAGERVGYCFVELLPGVRNPGKYIGFHNLLKRR